MPRTSPKHHSMTGPESSATRPWKVVIALSISSLMVLAALIALRGPDSIAADRTRSIGAWLLTGPSFWHFLTPQALVEQLTFFVAGVRGWQNAHVIIAWLTAIAWFLSLPAKNWRGLGPLLPALLAVLLSSPASGLSGFGLAVLVLSLARAAALRRTTPLAFLVYAFSTWLAVWFSPAAIVVAAAAWIEIAWSRPIRFQAAALLIYTLATLLTPRGISAWNDAWIFLFWSPQAPISGWAVLPLLLVLVALAFALRGAWHQKNLGTPLAAAFLLLNSLGGQTNLLWPATLWMIPAWPIAKEQLRRTGLNIRWFAEAAALLLATALVAGAALEVSPRWFALAMTDTIVRPTLTREAIPEEGTVYVNTTGAPFARFSGAWSEDFLLDPDPRTSREPSLWRALDRQHRYRAVWLAGDPSGYAPLARHLGQSPDWRLEAVDPTGVVFVRAPRESIFATEPAQQMAQEKMWGGANRSTFLAESAISTLAANFLPEAGELSQSAVRNSDRSAPASATRARVLASLGETDAALAESQRALQLDPTLLLAWQVRTECLLQAQLNDNAYAASREAVRLAPGDLGTLWLAARAAHQARAFQTEAELLENLIALTEGRGGDASFYQLYLGQAYAKLGLTRPALRALDAAARAPGLTPEQQREIDEEISTLRSHPAAR
jgi:hypothetical protein